MSSIGDDEIENTSKNKIYEEKPKYVKRLNFGQTILNINTVDRPNTFNGNNFIINNDVARIPITEKEDFVRGWIEAHDCNVDCSSNLSNQSSPVLGTSKFKEVETSPVLGVCNKNRTRLKSGNDLMKKKEVYNHVKTSPVLGSLKKRKKKLHFMIEKKQSGICTDNDESVHNSSLYTNSRHDNLPNANVNISPVLLRDAYCYKRKRRRTISHNDQARNLNSTAMETSDGTDKNMNLLVPVNRAKDLNPLRPEILNFTAKYRIQNGKNNKIDNEKKNVIACSSSSVKLKENKIKRQSSKDNASYVIESVSSDDSDTNDDGMSNIIEDIDIQETVPLAKTSISGLTNKWIAASPENSDETFYSEAEFAKISSATRNEENVTSYNDSDKTFFSKAKSVLSAPSIFPSNLQDKISQVTASSDNSKDSKLSQTNFTISNVTSPIRTNSWPAMSLQLIDSCKKKRRVKKNSVARKLQTLISRQISFVRIWHHQMKQADMDGTFVPHIIVYVDKCTMHFYRQFLEGIVLDDPFNMLSNNESDGTTNICETLSTKMITMFITPDIVGKIEMKSNSIVKVYPPWDIMDESKMILNVTYIKVMTNEQRNYILSKIKIPDRKRDKVLIQEFNCPCLEADKILPSCEKRVINEKPDVMEELFNF